MNPDPATPTPASTETPAPAASKTRTRSAQPRAIAYEITSAAQLFGTVNANPDIAAALAAAGFPQDEFNIGVKLQHTAQATYDSRQAAEGKAEQARAARAAIEVDARQTYGDYRKIAQAAYSKAADRKALGAGGPLPEETKSFVTTARAAYSAARQPAYASALAKMTYDTARLDAAVANLDALDAAESAYLTAMGAAADALRVRNQAAHDLATWIRKFRRIAAAALRNQSEMRQKLGL